MTERPTQHHGPEALRDGLEAIWSESQNLLHDLDQFTHLLVPLRQGTRLYNPYLELAFSIRSRHKAFQPVLQPNVMLDRTSQISEALCDLVFLLYPRQYPISLPQRPEEGTFNRTQPIVQSGHRATAPVQSGHYRLLHDDRGPQYGRVTTRQPQYSRVTAGHYPVRVTTQPWAMIPSL
ncbi:hypothetical protein F2Q68_00011885 [Brassica cretica]|uniref:Uncharacterized protein n=1 Tax=Brassica cretica TaxID=69181 RepID=A0A3N6QU69_BRACR|nr:hypothetical protein F2Q68_00011885 [Brassica cretica]